MAATNIILGYGETLTTKHDLARSGGEKSYPYQIAEQRQWLEPQLQWLRDVNETVRPEAKPRGEAVAKFTLHPTFLAKSHHPQALLTAAGLRCIGSRAAYVRPRKGMPAGAAPAETLFTAMLYVAGRDDAYAKLEQMLLSQKTAATHQKALCRFEQMLPFMPGDKNFVKQEGEALARLEVVLHASAHDTDIHTAFLSYVKLLGGKSDLSQALTVSGLTFVPVTLPVDKAVQLGAFQFVRVVRAMPSLRIGGREMRSSSVQVPALPTETALDPRIKVAVFDGGLGHTDLGRWVSEEVLEGAESTSAAYLNHGNGVTSTLLFGPIAEGAPAFPRPYANAVHYRCISPALQVQDGVPDIDLYAVLKNIDQVLKNNTFDFINFSVGPYMPIVDEEIHPWTALLDSHFANGNTLAAIAVGNDGDKEWPDARVQPPSDMVNAIAVGACNTTGSCWERAPYSSYGPGRSPGMVKPDGVTFGGSAEQPFVIYNALSGQYAHTSGTSFSSPALLRVGIGLKASLNFPLNMLAVRALLAHHAHRPKTMSMSHVGHGRFPQTIDEVLTCDDNEVRVIYQGQLQAGQNLRALIPFPDMPLNGRVTLRATLCFSSQTDPEHAVNYTRAGLSVTLRPKRSSKKTMPFFSAAKMYTPELEARMDDQKWETTLKHEHRFNVDTLDDPIFDITYGARLEGQSVDNDALPPLPYAMVITVSAEDTPGVYNNIRQRYQTLQPVSVRQEVRIKNGTGKT
ncbi:S8 family serine peptidase [Duganella sp. FT92W]|uniref:S8 family serine peptidase n=1 Tax=Pseudoduganella rivuli TaxID=2666085 RepID=A0A7X2IIU9_9BURK|nr:S8 family peptidase [Pseudoduganella rivuli]MRV70674.1 S8 family serine peptidase [Pseudoduganella rivuli]